MPRQRDARRGGSVLTPCTPSRQTRHRACSANASHVSSLQRSIARSRRSVRTAVSALRGCRDRAATAVRLWPSPHCGRSRMTQCRVSCDAAARGSPPERRRGSAQRVGLGHEPAQLGRSGPIRSGYSQHRQPQLEPRAQAANRSRRPVPPSPRAAPLQVGQPDPASRQLLAIRLLRQIRLAAEDCAPCFTASSNGRSSKACSVLWWMKTVIGPWAGSRWAACSMRVPQLLHRGGRLGQSFCGLGEGAIARVHDSASAGKSTRSDRADRVGHDPLPSSVCQIICPPAPSGWA